MGSGKTMTGDGRPGTGHVVGTTACSQMSDPVSRHRSPVCGAAVYRLSADVSAIVSPVSGTCRAIGSL